MSEIDRELLHDQPDSVIDVCSSFNSSKCPVVVKTLIDNNNNNGRCLSFAEESAAAVNGNIDLNNNNSNHNNNLLNEVLTCNVIDQKTYNWRSVKRILRSNEKLKPVPIAVIDPLTLPRSKSTGIIDDDYNTTTLVDDRSSSCFSTLPPYRSSSVTNDRATVIENVEQHRSSIEERTDMMMIIEDAIIEEPPVKNSSHDVWLYDDNNDATDNTQVLRNSLIADNDGRDKCHDECDMFQSSLATASGLLSPIIELSLEGLQTSPLHNDDGSYSFKDYRDDDDDDDGHCNHHPSSDEYNGRYLLALQNYCNSRNYSSVSTDFISGRRPENDGEKSPSGWRNRPEEKEEEYLTTISVPIGAASATLTDGGKCTAQCQVTRSIEN